MTAPARIGHVCNYMAQVISLGLAGASALALAFGGGNSGWTTDHKLSGIAHALWDLRYDEKGERFGAGVPEPGNGSANWVRSTIRALMTLIPVDRVLTRRWTKTLTNGAGTRRCTR